MRRARDASVSGRVPRHVGQFLPGTAGKKNCRNERQCGTEGMVGRD